MPDNFLTTDSIPQIEQDLSKLSSLSFDDVINNLVNDMVHFALNLLIAIAVLYIGKFIIRKIYNLTSAILMRRDVDRSLSTFILSLIRIVLYFILIVTVISILGINTSSFLALFASAGVAIGMALSGTLQNFAGGVLILLLKPYKVGDYIEAQGFAGTVTEIQIFSTIINTYDNKSIIIPNGGLSTGSINNWSREDYRRIDWNVSISYGDNVDTARKAILALFDADDRIVRGSIADDRQQRALEAEAKTASTPQAEQPRHGRIYRLFHRRVKAAATSGADPWDPKHLTTITATAMVDRSPSVMLGSLGESSVDLKVRAWVRTPDYWTVFYDYNERIYNELPRHGVSFPFPQMDVHISNTEA